MSGGACVICEQHVNSGGVNVRIIQDIQHGVCERKRTAVNGVM